MPAPCWAVTVSLFALVFITTSSNPSWYANSNTILLISLSHHQFTDFTFATPFYWFHFHHTLRALAKRTCGYWPGGSCVATDLVMVVWLLTWQWWYLAHGLPDWWLHSSPLPRHQQHLLPLSAAGNLSLICPFQMAAWLVVWGGRTLRRMLRAGPQWLGLQPFGQTSICKTGWRLKRSDINLQDRADSEEIGPTIHSQPLLCPPCQEAGHARWTFVDTRHWFSPWMLAFDIQYPVKHESHTGVETSHQLRSWSWISLPVTNHLIMEEGRKEMKLNAQERL